MRIESIHFKNYKLLRDATLPLEPLTVIVGPNGSGKSTVLEAIRVAARTATSRNALPELISAYTQGVSPSLESLELRFATRGTAGSVQAMWAVGAPSYRYGANVAGVAGEVSARTPEDQDIGERLVEAVKSYRSFALAPDRMREPVALHPGATLTADGSTLSSALDQLRDRDPDAWQELNEELGRWLPEFDRILFDTPEAGMRLVALRTKRGQHKISAGELSSGTLLSLGILTIVYGETAPQILGIEEPEAGIHPRLLRNVRDALFRMAYPSENGSDAAPRQVIVTTHSPYLLDLFRDVPECVVIAERRETGVEFRRLTDHPDIDDILSSGPLGDAWYSGVLGGVPVEPQPAIVYPVGARDAA